MKRRLLLITLIAGSGLGFLKAASSQENAQPPKMKELYLVMLKRAGGGPTDKKELEQLQQRHISHILNLIRDGHAIAAGPTDDHTDGSLRGILIMHTKSLEEARRLEEADPMVKAGRLKMEVATWWVPEGQLTSK